MRLLPLALLASAFAASPAIAQSINVDVGSVFGTPTSGYGAAAAQAGFWNSKTTNAATALSDLSGTATGATLAAAGGVLTFGFDNLGTSGDDQALLDDLCDGARTWTFSGLANGSYDVYTYAWAPDNSTYATNVAVQGSPDPSQVVGGAWGGSHQQGLTYARHAITISNGTIIIDISTASGFSSVNGFQIVDTGGGCTLPSNYCTAKVSSNGCVPSIGFTGSNSVSAGTFAITGSMIEGGQLGVVFYGTTGTSSMPFQGGFLCVAPPVIRLPVQNSGGTIGTCNGTYTQPAAAAVLSSIGAGNMGWFQIWFRDPGAASGTGLSDGLEVPVCP